MSNVVCKAQFAVIWCHGDSSGVNSAAAWTTSYEIPCIQALPAFLEQNHQPLCLFSSTLSPNEPQTHQTLTLGTWLGRVALVCGWLSLKSRGGSGSGSGPPCRRHACWRLFDHMSDPNGTCVWFGSSQARHNRCVCTHGAQRCEEQKNKANSPREPSDLAGSGILPANLNRRYRQNEEE